MEAAFSETLDSDPVIKSYFKKLAALAEYWSDLRACGIISSLLNFEIATALNTGVFDDVNNLDWICRPLESVKESSTGSANTPQIIHRTKT